MFEELKNYKLTQLHTMALKLGIPARRNKDEMIKDISALFSEYEEYKKDKLDRYTRYEQLGEKGKEGTTYLVKDKDGKEYAMKTFRPFKSSDRLKKEYSYLRKAGKKGISPKAVDYDTVSKYIVMEKMDSHLYSYLDEKKGELSKTHQKRILEIFKTLDNLEIFHNDANITNYMFKNGIIYLIDYGFSKSITPKLIKELGTDKPNLHLMTIGLILKLKEKNV